MSVLEDIGNAIAEGFGIEDTSKVSFRPPVEERQTAADPTPVEQQPIQEAVEPQEEIEYEATSFAVPDFGPIDFDPLGDDDFVYADPSEEELRNRREESLDQMAIQKSEEGTLAAPADKDMAEDEYIRLLQDMENPQGKGRKIGADGKPRYFPFKSLEGKGPDGKTFSGMEIGFGNKIPQSWLSDDQSKWPVVEGVPVNVKDGLTERQAKALMQASLESSRSSASSKVPGFDKMTAWEQQYWTDMTYNGGQGVTGKNPKAIKAAKDGYSAESMIRTFDFISAGGNKTRGLLNRRLNMFNLASSEISGLPAVEEYSWGPEGIRVKFASDITTDKVSKRFRDRINKAGGWYTVTKGTGDKQETFQLDDNFKFN